MAWYDYPIHHGYITQYQGPNTDTPHYADDLDTGSQIDIPITSLFEGDVVKEDYAPWGGEIFIRTNVPGIGPIEEYFYHNDLNEVHKGDHVKRGQEIALSGGQTSGGMNPTDPHYSTGPHIHVGFFTKYKPITEGGKTWKVPYGPDITPWVKSGGGPSSSPSDPCSQYQPWDPSYYFCLIKNGLLPGTHDPCANCTGAAKAQCHAALAAKVGKIPDCAQASIAKNRTEIAGNGPPGSCDKYPGGWLNPQYVICQMEQSVGVESNADLLYRAGFIGAGILFIVFGLMIFSRSFMSGVQESASAVV